MLVNGNKDVDMLTVVEELRREGKLEQAGGAYYISQLTNNIVSAAHIDYHIRILTEKDNDYITVGCREKNVSISIHPRSNISSIENFFMDFINNLIDSSGNSKRKSPMKFNNPGVNC